MEERYTIQPTGTNPYEGNDIAVYDGDDMVRGFNTLSDDYAWTNAINYKRDLDDKDKPAK